MEKKVGAEGYFVRSSDMSGLDGQCYEVTQRRSCLDSVIVLS